MALAPQQTRTFFTTSATWDRRPILQSHPLCDLLLEVIRENRAKQNFQIHEFVFMPDHVHLILTPAPLVPLEKAMQFVKGGFSHRAKKEQLFQGEIWQPGYHDHRIQDANDYANHVEYITRRGRVHLDGNKLIHTARIRSAGPIRVPQP